MKLQKNTHGFTIAELMIVVTVMGILVAIVLNSVASAQSSTRDAKRITDVASVSKSLAAYSVDKGTLAVAGTGASNTGIGWIDYGGPLSGYSKSIQAGLQESGYLKDNNLKNPKPDPSFLGSYLVVSCTGTYTTDTKFAVAVKLERPTSRDTIAYNAWKSSCPTYASALDTAGMNFVRIVNAGF